MVDAWRPEHARGWYPGEAVLRSADVIIVGKADTAPPAAVARAGAVAREVNAHAPIVPGHSAITLDAPDAVRGRRVLVVEDGPTLTHGGMAFGAGTLAARAAGAAELVDPRPFAPPELQKALAAYPHLGPVLPAIGYSAHDLDLLARTIAAAPVDLVVVGTPIDLGRLVAGGKPLVRARYEFSEPGPRPFAALLERFIEQLRDPTGLRP
jgi:predicted GTPase